QCAHDRARQDPAGGPEGSATGAGSAGLWRNIDSRGRRLRPHLWSGAIGRRRLEAARHCREVAGSRRPSACSRIHQVEPDRCQGDRYPLRRCDKRSADGPDRSQTVKTWSASGHWKVSVRFWTPTGIAPAQPKKEIVMRKLIKNLFTSSLSVALGLA